MLLSEQRLKVAAVGISAAATVLFVVAATLGIVVPGDDGVDVVEIGFLAAFLSYALVGGLIAWHRPANPVGWLLLATGLAITLSAALDGYAYFAIVHRDESVPGGVWARWAQSWLFVLAWDLGTTLPLLFFPDGRPPSPRWRWLIRLTAVAIVADTVAVALMPGPIGDTVPKLNPLGWEPAGEVLSAVNGVVAWVCATVTIVALASLVLRWRSASGPMRRRLAWLGLGGLVAVGIMAVATAVDAVGVPAITGRILGAIALAVLPAAVAVAILRAGLFDIEAVFTRGIIYAGLTAIVLASYAIGLAVSSALFSDRADIAAALVAAALVAVLLGGARERVQRSLERALFGERSRPYVVLANLGAVAQHRPATDLLPEMAALVRRSMRLPYVGVHGPGDRLPVESGTPTPYLEAFPLGPAGGELRVARRDAGEEFTAAERELFADAARQIALAARAAELASELQAARERLVRSREQERLRIRRDLHDGLGPVLAAVTLQLDVLRSHLNASDADGGLLADKIKGQLRTALNDVRRLTDGLRPPALDETGLRSALIEQSSALLGPSVVCTVDCPEKVFAAGPAAEVAVYRIAVEALTNAARHARADHVTVNVRVNDDDLVVTVIDDGCGFAVGRHDGIGLSSMRERAAELGGRCEVTSRPGHGVAVCASVPREDP